MGLRVIVTLLITGVGIRMSFINAFYGLIAYAFWSYTYPEKATWGLLPISNLSYIMGLTVVVTTVVQKKKLFINDPVNTAIMVFWFLCLLSLFTAGIADLSMYQFTYFTRVIIVTLIITLLVNDFRAFRIYAWTMVLFIGLVAAQAGILGFLRGVVGGASYGYPGVMNDRNYTAITLCAIVPIIFYMIGITRNRWAKVFLAGVLMGTILAIYLTYARAGFIGLFAVGAFIVMKSKHKILNGLLAFIFVFAMFMIIPREYVDRIMTMKNVDVGRKDVDLSAVGRIEAWKGAIQMMKSLPITGVGFYGSMPVMKKYAEPQALVDMEGKSIHNTFLQVGAEIGLPGLILYICVFLVTYLRLSRLKKKVAIGVIENREVWAYASMLQAAFVGFFSCGFFSNGAFIDISWHLLGLTVGLEHMAVTDLSMEPAA